jgi:hypothetical protein
MKYFISSLGFRSKNVTSILNKNLLLLKKIFQNLQHEPYYLKQGATSRDTDNICEQLKNKLKL